MAIVDLQVADLENRLAAGVFQPDPRAHRPHGRVGCLDVGMPGMKLAGFAAYQAGPPQQHIVPDQLPDERQ